MDNNLAYNGLIFNAYLAQTDLFKMKIQDYLILIKTKYKI